MTYTLHNLSAPVGSRHAKKRIGRGNASGHGTYSTRGLKGQRARSGGRRGLKRKGMRRIIASLPKFGGFRSLRVKPETVTLQAIDAGFASGEPVTLAALKKHGLASVKSRAVKVVGGEIKKKLALIGLSTSAGAKAAVERAGGSVKQ